MKLPKNLDPTVSSDQYVRDMKSMMRDAAIGKVQNGRWDPKVAERVVARLKMDQLATKPDPSDFDPMGRASWSLTMAIAWLGWRTPERVRECWDDYRRECWDWRWYRSHGWELRQCARMTLTSLIAIEAIAETKETMIMSFAAAKAQLWEALASEALIATAIQASTGRPFQVPAHECHSACNIDPLSRGIGVQN